MSKMLGGRLRVDPKKLGLITSFIVSTLEVFVIVLLLSLACSSFLISLKLLLLELFAFDFILLGLEMKSVENDRFFSDSKDFNSGGTWGEFAEAAGNDPLRDDDLLTDGVDFSVR